MTAPLGFFDVPVERRSNVPARVVFLGLPSVSRWTCRLHARYTDKKRPRTTRPAGGMEDTHDRILADQSTRVRVARPHIQGWSEGAEGGKC